MPVKKIMSLGSAERSADPVVAGEDRLIRLIFKPNKLKVNGCK